MEDIKTLWELLQEVVENDDDKWYSLHEFLLEAKKSDLKRIEEKLTEADQKQFYEYMDGFDFVNENEVYMACSEYYEKTMNRPLCMWECGDMSEIADDYIRERNLKFEEDEADLCESKLAEKDLQEEIILPF